MIPFSFGRELTSIYLIRVHALKSMGQHLHRQITVLKVEVHKSGNQISYEGKNHQLE